MTNQTDLPSARAIMAQAVRLATSASATERDLAQARTLVLIARELREGTRPLPQREPSQLAAGADVATALGAPLPAVDPVSAPFFDAAAAQFGTTYDGTPAYLAPPAGDEAPPAPPETVPAEPGVTTTATDFDHLRQLDLSGVRRQFRQNDERREPEADVTAYMPVIPPDVTAQFGRRLPGEGTEGTCRFCGHAIVYARQNREQQEPVWHHVVTQQRVCPVGVLGTSGHTFASPTPTEQG
jgi:hypothetical protein